MGGEIRIIIKQLCMEIGGRRGQGNLAQVPGQGFEQARCFNHISENDGYHYDELMPESRAMEFPGEAAAGSGPRFEMRMAKG